MKKVIICLLLLIPILVILTIDASGKLIASALVDIPAESVAIKHGGEVLESDEIYLEDYKDTDNKYTVFCEVFPGIATDEMIWNSSNPRIARVTPDPERSDAADITFYDYGSVDITCTSKKNSSISARATIYVGGLIPGYMTIGDFVNESITEMLLPRYSVSGVVANVKPAASVKEEKVAWSTSDAAVATVDSNGVITAKNYGTCLVTATVTAKDKTVSATLTVKVEGDALSREAVVYSYQNSVNLASYPTSESVTVEGGEDVALGGVADFGVKEVVFKKGEERQTVYVVKLPQEKSLVIENYYALKAGALSGFIALGTSNIRLNAVATDGSTPDVTWHSTDENVIVVREGRLYAIGSGQADIYPSAEGYAAQRLTLNVTSPVEDFRLAETTFRDEVGLLQQRVFGNRTYKDGQFTNTYTLKIASTYPLNASISAFTFESMDTDVATVDRNGVIHFASDVAGREVTIAAFAYNQQGLPVRQTYTFHMVNGVNIAVDTPDQHFNAQAGEKPDFTPYRELKALAKNDSVKAIVLHNDVYFAPAAEGGETIKNLAASIYGNGNKLDGQFLIHSVEETDKLLLWDFDHYPDMPDELSVELVNLNMQATQPTSDDAQKAFEELSAKGGGAIGVLGAYDESKHFSLYVKGCLFQYAYGHVNTAIGDSVYDGCIFRNNSASAIVLQQSSFGIANAKIKNCIFSNTIAPVGIACGNFNDILARFTGAKGVKSQFGTFELEGNNYVYNWKRLSDVQMSLLPRGLENENANLLVDQVNEKLGKIIREAFEQSDEEHLYIENIDEYNAISDSDELARVEYLQKHSYLNFSFLMIGIWENMDPRFNPEEYTAGGINIVYDKTRYKAVKVNAEFAPSVRNLMTYAKMLDIDIKQNETYHIVCRDEKGNFNTMPGETYTIGPEVYAKLRGDTPAASLVAEG